MLYFVIIGHLLSLKFSSNYNFLPKESKWEERVIGVHFASQYRSDKASNEVVSIEYLGRNIDDIFRFNASALITSEQSSIFSFGTAKDIFINEKFFISSHFLPSFAFIKNKDFKNSTNGIKFNIGFEIGYLTSQNTAISLEWRHLSSNYTKIPNVAIDTVGIKFKLAF